MRTRERVIVEYLCDDCGKLIADETGQSYHCFVKQTDDNNRTKNLYCGECAVKKGILDPLTFMQLEYENVFGKDFDHAEYNPESEEVTGFYKWGRGFRKIAVKV